METLFRWIHLSDIHVGHGDAGHGWDQKFVMDVLRRDIASIVERQKSPADAILVTGDIAFSGGGVARKNPQDLPEYAEAKAWLTSVGSGAGVSPKSIFLVPGNHDVDRKADNDGNVQRLVEILRAGGSKRSTLDAALASPGDRALLARRMQAYLELSADFAPFCERKPTPTLEERLFWVESLAARGGLRIRLVGLNTALLAADDDDQGKLRLGNAQIVAPLLERSLDPGELVMVLSHHPFESAWLFDEKETLAKLRNHTHLHLSGHVHEADSWDTRFGGGRSFARIVAGSVHGEPGVPASHGYSFGEVVQDDTGKLKLRIWPRKWSAKNARFQVDTDNVGSDSNQPYAEHDLAVQIPRLVSPPPARPSPTPTAQGEPALKTPAGQPIELFFSYAEEDEELKTKLEKHFSLLRRKDIIKSVSGRKVSAGDDWKGVVDARLRSAKIILLLISNDYLASDYCFDSEMAVARERMEAGEARVIPVLLRPSDFHNVADTSNNERAREVAWFEKLQPLPGGRGAVTQWPNLDEALMEITKQIRLLAEKMH